MRPLLTALLFGATLASCDGGRSVFTVDNGNPLQPVVEFAAPEWRVIEGALVMGVPITVTHEPSGTLSVPYTFGGSALEGVDFVQLTPSPLKLAKGQVQAEILFEVFEDGTGEVDESIRLELHPIQGAELGEQTRCAARIEDDDQKEVLELEPNDDLGTAQDLGWLRPNAATHVQGAVTPAGAGDPYDVYRFHAYTDMRVRFALDPFGPDADLAVRLMDDGGATVYLLDEVGIDDFEEGAVEVLQGDYFLEVTTRVSGTDYLLQMAGEPLVP